MKPSPTILCVFLPTCHRIGARVMLAAAAFAESISGIQPANTRFDTISG
jgi:hypothetical protein